MKHFAFAILLAALPIAAASAASPEPQASIPFVSHGGIRDWRAIDRETLYVQDGRRRWYRADLFAPCLDLPYARSVGFETRGADRFDKFSTVRVRGQRCFLKSLVRSDPPAAKARRDKSAGA